MADVSLCILPMASPRVWTLGLMGLKGLLRGPEPTWTAGGGFEALLSSEDVTNTCSGGSVLTVTVAGFAPVVSAKVKESTGFGNYGFALFCSWGLLQE